MKSKYEYADSFGFIAVLWIISLAVTGYMFGVLMFTRDEISSRSTFFGVLCVTIFLDLLFSFLLYVFFTVEKKKEIADTEKDDSQDKNNEQT